MVVMPATVSATLTSAARLVDVMNRLREFPWGRRIRLHEPDKVTLNVSCGSRLSFRLLGQWARRDRLPLRVVLRLSAGGNGTLVHLDMTSDEGWYLVQTELGLAAYRQRFEELLRGLEANGMTRVR